MNKMALRSLSYGLYIVSSRKGDKLNGQIANTVFQTTSTPLTITASIHRDNFTHECIRESGAFSVSVLSVNAGPNIIGPFGFRCGRDIEKFSNLNYKMGKTGVPVVLEDSIAYLEARVIKSIELNTHTLYIGDVVAAEVTAEGEPLTYAYYHEVKKGKTPEKAATFIDAHEQTNSSSRSKYVCTVCEYVFDPAMGDPENNIPAGTAFQNIPADWKCPVCGVGKDKFRPLSIGTD